MLYEMNTDTSMMTVGVSSVTPDRLGTVLLYDPFGLRPVIRDADRQAGAGDLPLSGITELGTKVLLKPNWVLDCNEGGHGMKCLVNQPGFIPTALRRSSRRVPRRPSAKPSVNPRSKSPGTHAAGSTTVDHPQPMCKPRQGAIPVPLLCGGGAASNRN